MSKILQHPALPDYSWRFAFLLGFGLSIVGYVIRKKLRESPAFISQNFNRKDVPLIKGFSFLKIEFLAAFLVAGASNGNFYYLLIFIPNYLNSAVPLDLSFLGLTMTVSMLFFIPMFGWLSDKLNRTSLLTGACAAMALYNLFFLKLVLAAPSGLIVAIYAVISAAISSAIVCTINVFVIEIFPAKYRFSCAAVSYSIGAALFGGTVPMAATFIVKWFDNVPLYLGIYMSFISILGSIGGLLVKYRKRPRTLFDRLPHHPH